MFVIRLLYIWFGWLWFVVYRLLLSVVLVVAVIVL